MEYVDCTKNKTDIHPLPLLTAAGFGKGKEEPKKTGFVGKWAMNNISIEDEIPQGYTEVNVKFNFPD